MVTLGALEERGGEARETNDAERVMLENVIPDLGERPILILVGWARIIGGVVAIAGLVWLVWALRACTFATQRRAAFASMAVTGLGRMARSTG
jgi:hypothetical protein